MALQVALSESSVGASFPEAYARISTYRGDKTLLVVLVSWYANQQARIDDKNPVLQKEFLIHLPLLGNFYPSMYEWLKTQDEFAGAVDVLEAPVVEAPAVVPEAPAVEEPPAEPAAE